MEGRGLKITLYVLKPPPLSLFDVGGTIGALGIKILNINFNIFSGEGKLVKTSNFSDRATIRPLLLELLSLFFLARAGGTWIFSYATKILVAVFFFK